MEPSLTTVPQVLRCDGQQWVQTTRYHRSVMVISNGWRMWVLQSRVEELSRLQETNSQWEGIPISNGPRKNEYLKTSVRTSVLRFFGEVSSNGCRLPVTARVSWWSAMIGGCQAQQTSMERLNRLPEANSQWKGIPIGNGSRKKWIFKSISTNWQCHKFIFIGGSSMPWWNWEVIQRNDLKVIKGLVENCQARVFATFEQGQPTKFVEQTSDRNCMTIIFFNKTGSTTLNSFELLDIFGRIRIPRCSGILQVGTNEGQIRKIFSFLRTTICITPNKVESPSCLKADIWNVFMPFKIRWHSYAKISVRTNSA